MERDLATDAIFADLEGIWTLDRRIEGFGSMQGHATFRRVSSEVLEYCEEGLFKLESGSEFNAFRMLFFYRESPGIVVRSRLGLDAQDLLFRLKIEADAERPWPSVAGDEHLCGQDTYRACYTFEAPGRMLITIDVTGPRKNARIDTALSKLP